MLTEGGHVGGVCFEVEVEAVEDGVAEGAQGRGTGLGGSELCPEGVCGGDGVGLGGETAFGVGVAAYGEENCFSFGLAEGYVGAVGSFVRLSAEEEGG